MPENCMVLDHWYYDWHVQEGVLEFTLSTSFILLAFSTQPGLRVPTCEVSAHVRITVLCRRWGTAGQQST